MLPNDHKQRQQALEPHQSFIVQAPAGAGKTEMLTQRYLKLLAHVSQPEQIIAITFTRKAAHEMAQRIINALEQAHQKNCPEQNHKKLTYQLAQKALANSEKHQWDLLNQRHKLKILTIDGLCMHITQKMPFSSGLSTIQTLTSQPQQDYASASQELHRYLEQPGPYQDALMTLLQHLDHQESQLHALFTYLLTTRDQWLPIILSSQNNQQLKQNMEDTLKQLHQKTIDTILDLTPNQLFSQLIKQCQFAGQQCQQNQSNNIIANCAQLTTTPSIKDTPMWQGISACLLTQSNQWRKTIDKRCGFPSKDPHPDTQQYLLEQKQQMLDILTCHQAIPGLLSAWQQLRSLPPQKYNPHQWHILQQLLTLLPTLAAQLQIHFSQKGQVDFTEIASRALAAIQKNNETETLALAMDQQIQHLLVDEFQDTSPPQAQLLEALVQDWQPHENKTLFLVGDPMQSIYRFRQANVSLFINAKKNGIGPVKLTPLTLSNNFRSSPELIEWFNQYFPQTFPHTSSANDGAIHYSPSSSIDQTTTEKKPTQAHSICHESPQAETDWLIKHIKSQQLQNPNDDIAILVRARSHLPQLLNQLDQEQIAYQAIDIIPLIEHPACQDLVTLSTALAFPHDQLAWFSLLRSPLCGLSLSGLLTIKAANTSTIWTTITEQKLNLSPTDQQRLTKMIKTLKPNINALTNHRLSTTVQQCYLALGGPAVNPCSPEISTLFFKTLTELENQQNINHPNVFQQALQQTYLPNNTKAQIQVMTIHKAKGLEFDHVIMPFLHKQPPPRKQPLILWEQPTQQQHQLISPISNKQQDPDPLYRYLQQREHTKNQHELVRLLYVAATRAKKTITFTCHTNKEDQTPHPSTLAYLLKDQFTNCQHNYTSTTKQQHIKIKHIATTWICPITTEQPPTQNKHQPELITPPIERITGICLHESLLALSTIPIDKWHANDWLNQQEQQWHNKLQQLGYDYNQTLIKALKQTLKLTMQDPTAQWLLDCNHQQAHSELELITVIASNHKKFILDRTFINNNTRWIIDYKTTNATNATDDFKIKQQQKHHQQLHQYATAMRKIENTPIKLGLYFPNGQLWHHWDFQESLLIT